MPYVSDVDFSIIAKIDDGDMFCLLLRIFLTTNLLENRHLTYKYNGLTR